MGRYKKGLLLLLFLITGIYRGNACSILYYIDSVSGKIYAVNNEDYWYDVHPYLKIIPAGKGKLARLWYGWNNFAQGGINEAGLFFDGATTPEKTPITGYAKPKGNLGDEILANCQTVTEALDFLERHKIALTDGHLLFGDKTGNATVVEWVNGHRNLVRIKNNELMMTNFLLTDTTGGNYPCWRYEALKTETARLRQTGDEVGLNQVGGILAKTVQTQITGPDGKKGGTLYSTFFNITDMEFRLVYRLDNSKLTKLDLKNEFARSKKQTIKLK